ncbi:hypothetical protein TQ38_017695 [Novosphingobium sp. P6W]|nr:hypothetical protein TQ38_017695 [Novosphingobium sp. P6W]KIS32414.1 hypothetical protein TQ38_12395 [Novosphingobium sp. P6W]
METGRVWSQVAVIQFVNPAGALAGGGVTDTCVFYGPIIAPAALMLGILRHRSSPAAMRRCDEAIDP